ncbi:unnamed protein product, partial [Rotaria socialis]
RQLAVPAAKQLASAQLQKFNLLKEKFDRQQPIDIVFVVLHLKVIICRTL